MSFHHVYPDSNSWYALARGTAPRVDGSAASPHITLGSSLAGPRRLSGSPHCRRTRGDEHVMKNVRSCELHRLCGIDSPAWRVILELRVETGKGAANVRRTRAMVGGIRASGSLDRGNATGPWSGDMRRHLSFEDGRCGDAGICGPVSLWREAMRCDNGASSSGLSATIHGVSKNFSSLQFTTAAKGLSRPRFTTLDRLQML